MQLFLAFQDPSFLSAGPARLRAAMGAVLIVTVAWTLSTERSKISWRLVAWGLVLQFAFAGLVLQTPLGVAFFDWVNGLVSALLTYAEEGGRFIFGNLVSNNVPVGVVEGGQGFTETPGIVARTGAFFAFRIFPNIIFVSCLMTVLYHLGVMQRIVQLLAWIMQRTLRTSGAETLCAASNIFVGLTESPLLIKPFIRGMTESELMAVMTVGMATISGGVLAAYAGMMAPFHPAAAGHLIAASVMSAPAAFVIAKLLVPETGKPETLGVLDLEVQGEKPDVNVIDAAARGAAEGLKLALVVGAMLIAFIALVALANGVVGWAGSLAGFDGLSIEGMLGWILRPVAWLLGVTWVDAGVIGQLIGVDFVLNEFVAFGQLQGLLQGGAELQERSVVIGIYALATFANFGSVAMTIAGLGEIAPSRRQDLARLGMKSMLAGLLAALLTATFAGMLT
ncbi:MAG TPA: NupC/NupG family nucleoside CNT transporter [Gemmatimonadetes bacterium]|nr:NupC/NupG family nucleoside CNT transporter [Gemmatimonadota bacterium]